MILFGLSLCVASCFSNGKGPVETGHNPSARGLTQPDEEIPIAEPLVIKYRNDTLMKNKENFQNLFSDGQKEIILALNRISESQLRNGRILVIPDTFLMDLKYYSPFPDTLTSMSELDKLIIISKRIQAFALYEKGHLIRWGPVSTGKKSTPTPSRLYHTNFKALRKVSTINSSWIMPWYYNIESLMGIGIHEYVLPGYPASHACIRLFEKDAIFIYNWAEGWTLHSSGLLIKKGTPVVVFGEYDFEGMPPWRRMVDNHRELRLTENEMTELQSYLNASQEN